MKELDKKVNIIPIIAKADTISRQELLQFKKKVSNQLFVLKQCMPAPMMALGKYHHLQCYANTKY